MRPQPENVAELVYFPVSPLEDKFREYSFANDGRMVRVSGLLELKVADAELALAPQLGGAIARLGVAGQPVLRPWSGDEKEGLFALGSNIMVPFCNRIAGGKFEFNGHHNQVPLNVEGEQYPLHGDGFQREWTVEAQRENSAILKLKNGRIGPFCYEAEQKFSLTEFGLRIDLKLTNSGPETLPFGCGFHPWFPRSDQTRLAFAAEGVWMEDKNYLPTSHHDLGDMREWDFATPRALPDAWINKIWTDWAGSARVEQGPDAVSLTISASRMLDTALVYSPDQKCGFFCFEPMSHPTNALNMAGLPGLKVLRPGASLACWMALDWSLERATAG